TALLSRPDGSGEPSYGSNFLAEVITRAARPEGRSLWRWLMASVKLHDPDRMGYDLPDLCMKCGAPAMVYKAKTFSWHPGWVYILLFFGLLPFIIVALIMTRRMTVRVPLCEAHKNHWFGRFLILSGSFLALFAGGIALFMASLEPNRVGPRNDLSGL